MSDEHFNALPPGYQLQEYTVRSVLGHGGFGITYLAYDTNLSKDVAIKEYLPAEFAVRQSGATVKPRSSSDAEDYQWGLDRFVKEAQTLAVFRHPSVVPVYRFFQANGTAYMVMEYQRGQSLAELFRAHRAEFTEDDLMSLAMPLLDGLAVVHKAGYLHRDIKPGNIFIREDGSPVLLDFGAARAAVGRKSKNLTSIVTPGYAPLEQYFADGNQGAWTDIYALGGIFYQAVTGRIPPEAPARVKRDPIQPAIEAGRGRFSEPFLRAIDTALAVEEERRPQSADEWRAMLRGQQPSRTESVSTKASATILAGASLYGRDARRPEPSVRVPTGAQPAADGAASARFPTMSRDGAMVRPRRRSAVVLAAWIAAILIGASAVAAGGYFGWQYYDRQQTEDRQRRIERHIAEFGTALTRGDFAAADRELDGLARLDSKAAALADMRRKLADARRQADTDRLRQQIAKLTEDARRAIEQNRLDDADQLIAEAEKLDQTSPEVQRARIALDGARRRAAEAERRTQVQRLIETARRALEQRRYEDADKALDEAEKLEPASSEVKRLRQQLDEAERRARTEEQRREQAAKLVDAARQAIERGQLDEADRLLRQAQTNDPNTPQLGQVRAALEEARRRARAAQEAELANHVNEARAAIRRKDYNAAERSVRDAERIDANAASLQQVKRELAAARAQESEEEVTRLVNQARQAIQRKDFDAAERALREAERLDARSAAVQQARRELAAARAQDQNEENVTRLVGQARQAIQRKDFDAADRALREAERLDARSAAVQQARRELAAARAQESEEEVTRLVNQARQAIQRKDFDAADRALREAERLDARSAAVQQARRELAAARAQEQNEENVTRLVGQARQAIQRKDFDAAERALREAERLDPRSAAVQQARRELTAARAQSQNGDVDRLVAQARQAIQRKDLEGAERALREAERIDPRNAAVQQARRELAAARRETAATSTTSCPFSVAALQNAYGDETDCFYVQRTFTFALTTGQQGTITRWSNSKTNASGSITILQTTEQTPGNFCRRFQQSVTLKGQTRTGTGIACLRNNNWQITG